MARRKVSLSLDAALLRQLDEYLAAHAGTDRSKVVGQALQLWATAQQEAAMEWQFAPEDPVDPGELQSWREVRRAAASRRLRRA